MSYKVGFIGAGNMTQAIVGGWVKNNTLKPQEIYVTNRTPGKAKKLSDSLGVQFCENNEDVIESCDMVVLAMKPQDLESAIEPIASSFQDEHTVVSLAAGVTLNALAKLIPANSTLVRVMPNTPLQIGEGVIGYALAQPDLVIERRIENIFEPLGLVVKLDEDESFQALTVGAASGTGFVFELMIYWQEWLEEHGIEPEVAKQVTVKTFLGASLLADQNSGALGDLQSKVISKKGVTSAGLQSMRELEVERLLRYSFEKAVIRDSELSK
ncbi:MAG TPA: pyrroline-5-carboxylate reductase [Bdellovibrionales bacterium]|nr:hypothetical protein [Pseudobdellovibrionaceae bacterium]HAG92157.1 pyrroline-5-carboxylate reductase [Bdellovibrionales bacterium]|tara:strand:+ start:1142 stop:1948 length:807 start_codon:yes stop_codon:yes gene_type:complete